TQLVKDLYKGRLQHDSVLAKDSAVNIPLFTTALKNFQTLPADSFAKLLEPKHAGYDSLKIALKRFLSLANFKSYTRIQSKDSTKIPGLVYKRLTEVDSLNLTEQKNVDSIELAVAIKKYQKRAGLKVDGKMSNAIISRLNNTDVEKFIRIAITLDKYKTLQTLPAQYIWVNIPAYRLQVVDSDTIVMTSKVVVGKAETKTPQITSALTDMITYPKWHIPESIIKNDILPGLKKDPGYTLRKGYTLFDGNGNEVDPYSVDWYKYKTGIPYSVVQGSGDENALGVLKFNFPNKFSVYLHDTNQRYLFAKQARALSHGCVRVQAWQELAYFLLRNDSLQTGKALPVDSLNNWLAQKEKHVIPVRKKFPLFIRYFSCEAKDDRVVFYEDVYGEDKRTRERFFSNK
ncbi:MAG: L,D-transpeptidase family protein, partial [Bacteroidota bacterium]